MIHLDTHVAVWLRANDRRRLKPVRALLDEGPLRISPFVVLELQALFEIGRLRETGRWIADRLAEDHGIEVFTEHLGAATQRALDMSFTRDPYDRLIAAHALAANATLLTVDETLRAHVSCARWD